MSFKKPNLFIIGAPKCGTTSLAKWLEKHPNVYFSKSKEPHYFNKDGYQSITSINKYENLFNDVEDEKWIGEGSTWYMYSDVAVKNILEYSNSPKFIVCLRNPVEMCQSLYYQHLQNGDEYIETFDEAWSSQKQRIKKNNISKFCRFPDRLVYGEVSEIGSQLERVTQQVSKSDIHIVFLDDLKKNSENEFYKILRFLDLKEFEISYNKYNGSQIPRSKGIIAILNIVSKIKKKFNITFGTGLGETLKKLNSKKISPDYNKNIRKELLEYFNSEITKIEKLTGKSLDHWRK